jgi:FKBP-type peptidyl-prolyl cis-trans isomerase
MKRLLLVSVGLASLAVAGCDRPDLASDKGQYSYAIGYQIAKNMKGQGLDLDSKAFSAAVKDVMADNEGRMTEQQMRDAMKKMADARREGDMKASEENLKVANEFLAANKSKEGVKETASGLQYKVITEGKGKTPKASDVVEVHYKGTFIDGKEFDSSYKRNEPAQFPVQGVIAGWTEALQLMKEGSKYEIYLPPSLAYGEQGNPQIPGNSALVFEVELLKIVK